MPAGHGGGGGLAFHAPRRAAKPALQPASAQARLRQGGEANPTEPLTFQVQETEEKTDQRIRATFRSLRAARSDVFLTDADRDIALDAHTIQQAVYELSSIKLVDVDMDIVSTAFHVFCSAALKSEEGQYFTPRRVIRSAVQFMDIHYSDKVIDPACGTGGFLLESLLLLQARYPHLTEADLRTWAHDKVYGVDKDAINVKLVRAVMTIVGDGSAHISAGDSLRSHRWDQDYPHLKHCGGPPGLASRCRDVALSDVIGDALWKPTFGPRWVVPRLG